MGAFLRCRRPPEDCATRVRVAKCYTQKLKERFWCQEASTDSRLMIFVTAILVGDETRTGIDPRTGTIGLLFTTFIEKKNAPTNSTAKVGNALSESAHHSRARNRRGNPFSNKQN